MGELRWTNNSGLIVEWFAVAAFGSLTGPLKPGEEHRLENNPDIGQVGIRCITAPIYVIDSLDPPAGVDAHLLASDVIPMK